MENKKYDKELRYAQWNPFFSSPAQFHTNVPGIPYSFSTQTTDFELYKANLLESPTLVQNRVVASQGTRQCFVMLLDEKECLVGEIQQIVEVPGLFAAHPESGKFDGQAFEVQ